MYKILEYFNYEDCFFKPCHFTDDMDTEISINDKYPRMFHVINTITNVISTVICRNEIQLKEMSEEYNIKISSN